MHRRFNGFSSKGYMSLIYYKKVATAGQHVFLPLKGLLLPLREILTSFPTYFPRLDVTYFYSFFERYPIFPGKSTSIIDDIFNTTPPHFFYRIRLRQQLIQKQENAEPCDDDEDDPPPRLPYSLYNSFLHQQQQQQRPHLSLSAHSPRQERRLYRLHIDDFPSD